MELGKKLHDLRINKSLSQEEFAEKMNVSRQAVSKWELNQSIPEMHKIIEISKFFNVSLDYLIKEKIDENDNNIPSQTIDVSVNNNKKKSFRIEKMIILIILTFIMTGFRFIMTNDIEKSLILLLFASVLSIGLFIGKKFNTK